MPVIADLQGRPYAKLSDLCLGDIVYPDGGFTCLYEGFPYEIKGDPDLYIECSEGKHYLIGQVDDGECCIGIYKD